MTGLGPRRGPLCRDLWPLPSTIALIRELGGEILQPRLPGLPLAVGDDHEEVGAAELEADLQARAAWPRELSVRSRGDEREDLRRPGAAGDRSEESRALISTMLTAFVIFAAVMAIVTALAQRFFDRNVGKVLRDITAQMKKLAAGDSNVTISGKTRGDEIGDMARALEIFHRGWHERAKSS